MKRIETNAKGQEYGKRIEFLKDWQVKDARLRKKRDIPVSIYARCGKIQPVNCCKIPVKICKGRQAGIGQMGIGMRPWRGRRAPGRRYHAERGIENGNNFDSGFALRNERAKMIKQRISAGGIIVVNGKVLLVHHYQKNEFDFWVLPGGGIKGNEGILRAVEREVFEETNLTVNAEKIAYIEELMDGDTYVCKFWVYCSLVQGELSTEHKDADEGFLQDAKFFSEEELRQMNAFPVIVKNELWQDMAQGFSKITYLGYKQKDK